MERNPSVTTAEATIASYQEAAQAPARNEPAPSAVSVEEGVFNGYLARALKEWVIAGRPHKR